MHFISKKSFFQVFERTVVFFWNAFDFSREASTFFKMLSVYEQQAERLYELYRAGRMGEKSLLFDFCLLQRNDETAAMYLIFLLKRNL